MAQVDRTRQNALKNALKQNALKNYPYFHSSKEINERLQSLQKTCLVKMEIRQRLIDSKNHLDVVTLEKEDKNEKTRPIRLFILAGEHARE